MPPSGELIIDNWAAREAIKRQTQALDAVGFDRTVRGDLRRLLIHPETCKLPTPVADIEFFDRQLDEAKQAAVARALGSEDLLVVQSPPKTGNTTFITELILQTMLRNPRARILLTSQTHVALDNAVERLHRAGAKFRIVRIGRSDNARISKDVEKLLLENQMESWRDVVLSRGKQYLEKWADLHGISPQKFEVANHLRQLSALDSHLLQLKAESSDLTANVSELKQAATTAAVEEVEGFEELSDTRDQSI